MLFDMDLTPYVATFRHEVAVAVEAGGEDARGLADRMTAPLESAVRLTLLHALSDAMGEITRELAPGSVDLWLRGLEPEFVVTAPPREPPGADPPTAPAGAAALPAFAPARLPPDAEDAGVARINLRLSTHVKARAEQAAAQYGLSLNAWLVRAVSGALDPAADAGGAARAEGPAEGLGGASITGWAG